MGIREEEMIHRLLGGSPDAYSTYSSPSDMIKDVKIAGERYINRPECPFEVGDIVHPKREANKKSRGLPHYVAKVFPVERHIKEIGYPEYSSDIVVVVMVHGGTISAAFREDSMDYELYDPENIKTD